MAEAVVLFARVGCLQQLCAKCVHLKPMVHQFFNDNTISFLLATLFSWPDKMLLSVILARDSRDFLPIKVSLVT